MSAHAIHFQNVSRAYGHVLAVNDLTVGIGSGITGLVGPNGAGKTTFIGLAVGLLRPHRGRVLLNGSDPWTDPAARAALGYCPDGEGMWGWMSGAEFVETLGICSGLCAAEARQRAQQVLASLEMTAAADKPVRQYSKGMRQKVKLAQAMLHRPRILVLDEPLNGVDPVSRVQILATLKELASSGTAVLVSSHVLHELDSVADQVVLLHRGRLLASGKVQEIRALLDDHPHTVRLVSPRPRDVAKRLVELPGVVSVEIAGEDIVDARTRAPSALYSMLPGLVLDAGVPVHGVRSLDSGLEAVFRYLVKEDAR